MTETEVLRRINDLDPKLIEWSEGYTKRKRNLWKEILPVVIMALLCFGIVFGLFY